MHCAVHPGCLICAYSYELLPVNCAGVFWIWIDCNYQQIINLLDPDHGLLQNLLVARCVSPEQKADIESASSFRVRNSRIIDCLRRRDDFYIVSFTECLKRTKQHRLTSALVQSAGQIYYISYCMHCATNTDQDGKVFASFCCNRE